MLAYLILDRQLHSANSSGHFHLQLYRHAMPCAWINYGVRNRDGVGMLYASTGMKYDPDSIDREEYYYAYGEFMHNCLLGLDLRYYIARYCLVVA